MKKRLKLAGIILVILVIESLIWWFVPAHLCSIDAQQVEKIQIFDGNRTIYDKYRRCGEKGDSCLQARERRCVL